VYGRLLDHHHPHAEGHERDPDEDQDAGHALTRWRILGSSYRRQCMLQTRRGLRRNERLVLLILGGERWLVVGHAVNYHGCQEGGKGCRGTKGSVAGFTRNVAAPAGPFSARAEYGGAVRLTVVCGYSRDPLWFSVPRGTAQTTSAENCYINLLGASSSVSGSPAGSIACLR